MSILFYFSTLVGEKVHIRKKPMLPKTKWAKFSLRPTYCVYILLVQSTVI
ncbi:MAG: hypothetical protein Q8928_07920 [Bacteroidota bacterium]|nr:hypothetical protein [Bacteroidota bacterium]